MKNNIKYLLSIIALLALFISVGNIVMAEKSEELIKPETINAEDIGIKVNENEIIEEEFINDDSEVESEDMDVYLQEAETEESKENEETESTTPPEGKVEGYENGTYLEPNHNDCEIDEECYKCEECTFEEEKYFDEDVNGWVLDKTCIICGHGTSILISEEEAF